jgi:ribosomal silencing factor RsfS
VVVIVGAGVVTVVVTVQSCVARKSEMQPRYAGQTSGAWVVVIVGTVVATVVVTVQSWVARKSEMQPRYAGQTSGAWVVVVVGTVVVTVVVTVQSCVARNCEMQSRYAGQTLGAAVVVVVVVGGGVVGGGVVQVWLDRKSLMHPRYWGQDWPSLSWTTSSPASSCRSSGGACIFIHALNEIPRIETAL